MLEQCETNRNSLRPFPGSEVKRNFHA